MNERSPFVAYGGQKAAEPFSPDDETTAADRGT